MKIQCIQAGSLEANCYIVNDAGVALIIDPGGDAEKIANIVREEECVAEKIILTHGHFDHIGAADAVRRKCGAKIYIHRLDAPMLSDNQKNLSFLSNEAPAPFEADGFLNDGDSINVGNAVFRVYHTPGHSPGGICLYTDGVLFSGDLIFKGSIGRFDFGDFRQERSSVTKMIHMFDDDVRILPGHGEETTVGFEKKYNPYVERFATD